MLKLLIVDDEKRTREGLKKCIPWSSYGIDNMEEADDGTSALEIAREFKPDIIISDIRMTKMTGIEFASLIRKELPDCKIIFISGYSDKEYLRSAIRLKAINYIEKPVNIPELKSAVQSAVDTCNREIQNSRNISETSLKLEKSVELMNREFAANLAERRLNTEQISQILLLLDLDIPPDATYITLLFRLNLEFDDSFQKLDHIRSHLLESISCVFVQRGIKNITGLKDGMHLIAHIHYTSTLTLQTIAGFTNEILASFNKGSYTSDVQENILFAGIGIPVQGIKNVYLSYQTAFVAVQKVFFLGKARVIVYRENNEEAWKLDNDLLEHFGNLLSGSDANAVISFVESITESIRRHDSTLIDNVKNFFFSMLVKLYDEAEEKLLASFLQIRTREALWQKVLSSITLDQLKNLMLSELSDFFSIIGEKGSKSRAVCEIIDYIRMHYSNGNLTISDISGQLKYTRAYLCQIFKRETGRTIIDYLNEYRIGKAKELLKDRDLKLVELTNRLGFNDTKYFTRIFKKTTGLTPSEYRECPVK